jgi:hypothetical protein
MSSWVHKTGFGASLDHRSDGSGVEAVRGRLLQETSKTFTTFFARKVSKSDHERFLARLDQRVRGEIDDAIWLSVLRQFELSR